MELLLWDDGAGSIRVVGGRAYQRYPTRGAGRRLPASADAASSSVRGSPMRSFRTGDRVVAKDGSSKKPAQVTAVYLVVTPAGLTEELQFLSPYGLVTRASRLFKLHAKGKHHA